MDFYFPYGNFDSEELALQLDSLVYYQSILQQEPMQEYINLLYELEEDDESRAQMAYAQWNRSLYKNSANQSWAFWLMEQLIISENPFQKQIVQQDSWRQALQNELRTLFLAMKLDGRALARAIESEKSLDPLSIYDVGPQLPQDSSIYSKNFLDFAMKLMFASQPNFQEIQDFLVQNGNGLPAIYNVLQIDDFIIRGANHMEEITQESLFDQRGNLERLNHNIENFLANKAFSHTVLLGPKGSGKASMIKAQVSRYKQVGLRLIFCRAENIPSLPFLLHELQKSPLKFMIYIEDVHFQDDDYLMQELGKIIDGSAHKLPSNILFAMSSSYEHENRNHSQNKKDSSERNKFPRALQTIQYYFTLILNFPSLSDDEYLMAIDFFARQNKIKVEVDKIQDKALDYAKSRQRLSVEAAKAFVHSLNS